MKPNPSDELAYRSRPIEWSAPERLAVCSLLHGGPRARLERYRVLELGSGDGANLIPLAYYRSHAEFVGVDGSRKHVDVAETKRRELGLLNLRFVHEDFAVAARELEGTFDFILMHGVFSWVSDTTRDLLLALCAAKLAPGGLLYLNYNAKPGWNIRGMVREFLLAQTQHMADLVARAGFAQQVAAKAVQSFEGAEHAYAHLMAQEFRFVCSGHPSWIAHEFLAPDNHAYWRSEFLALANAVGLRHVADADFNYDSGRLPVDAMQRLSKAGLDTSTVDDTLDFVSYRQMHAPILTQATWAAVPATADELSRLSIASALAPLRQGLDPPAQFRHPTTGYEVEVRSDALSRALLTLAKHFPQSFEMGSLFGDVTTVTDDVKLLYEHGLISLSLPQPTACLPTAALHECERRWADHLTDPYHRLLIDEGGTAK